LVEYRPLVPITLPLAQPVQGTELRLCPRNPKRIAKNAPTTNALTMAVRRASARRQRVAELERPNAEIEGLAAQSERDRVAL
jgi:hypothetical protein